MLIYPAVSRGSLSCLSRLASSNEDVRSGTTLDPVVSLDLVLHGNDTPSIKDRVKVSVMRLSPMVLIIVQEQRHAQYSFTWER